MKFNTCSQRKIPLEYIPERIKLWNDCMGMFWRGLNFYNVICVFRLVKSPGAIRKLEIMPADCWSGIEELEDSSMYYAISTVGKLQR